jgi:hypothetical protein
MTGLFLFAGPNKAYNNNSTLVTGGRMIYNPYQPMFDIITAINAVRAIDKDLIEAAQEPLERKLTQMAKLHGVTVEAVMYAYVIDQKVKNGLRIKYTGSYIAGLTSGMYANNLGFEEYLFKQYLAYERQCKERNKIAMAEETWRVAEATPVMR